VVYVVVAGLAERRSRGLVAAVRRLAQSPGRPSAVPWASGVLVLAEGPVPVARTVSARMADRRATWTDPAYLLAGLAVASPDRHRVDDEHHVTSRGQPRAQTAGFEGQDWTACSRG
jgi:hypothetical protein